MNTNSHLCRFVEAHPTDFVSLLEKQYSLRIKREGDLAIFNYEINANFYDPIVQEARGIIIDVVRREVVCWPFRKFGNHTEGYADPIDWDTARVLEKIDGSIIKLWFDYAVGEWRFSTNRTICADVAGIEGSGEMTYGALVRMAENYGDIPFDSLDKNSTYIFELISPKARVVISYEKTMLYHLGTRNNLTGEEREEDIGIQKPASYPLKSLDDCIHAAAVLNCEGTGGLEHEGFVVVDAAFRRVKVKSFDYIASHRIATMKSIGREECLTLLLGNRSALDEICACHPHFVPTVRYYEYRLAELFHQADVMADFSKQLFEEYSFGRKAVALVIAKHRLAFVGFLAIKNGQTGRQILLDIPMGRWIHLIPEYQPEDIVASLKKT